MMLQPPIEINESLRGFKEDHPDPAKVGFLMMRFGVTEAHDSIVAAIKEVLSQHGLDALRADEKNYHDNLLPNIKTYMWGCGFGIAVFERIESEEFNPNVSFEVGYMMALQKPVCLLKDKTLRTLQSDLIARLYYSFDTQDPSSSLSKGLEAWLSDKKLIA